jgi:tetratricopeptide (TPR) repeat protein
MASTSDEVRRQARGYFDGADFAQCLQVARQGLITAPDDIELLVLAGRAGVEVDAEEAAEYLRRATELAPEEADPWHHYGEALAAEGRMPEADAAFRRAVELDPDDQVALTHLGHTALAAGRNDEGVGYLARAADIAHGASTAAISLVDMYRAFGQYDDALAQGRRLAEAAGDDVLAWLDVAELSLQVGQLDGARSAFERLRDLDDVPGHEVYPVHGLLQVEIRRQHWERARELAAQAATIDPRELSTDVAAFLQEQVSGPGEEPAPTRAEIEAALSASLAEYRRMHADDRRLGAGEPLG